MGAYYAPVSITAEEKITSWQFSQGAKLMEHSYIGNTYVQAAMDALAQSEANEYAPALPAWKGHRFTWLCDYHDGTMQVPIEWEQTKDILDEEAFENYQCSALDSMQVLINLDKKQYVDMLQLLTLYRDNGDTEMLIHPLPILTNSSTEAMGGGDLHTEISIRNLWAGDHISVETTIPSDMTNITEDCRIHE